MTQPILILASGSPRRRAYMEELGVAHRIVPADIDETPRPKEHPKAYVLRMAQEKALKVAALEKGQPILAADTTVCRGRRIYGKPEDAADAFRMIEALAGKRHKVLSAVSVIDASGTAHSTLTQTVVQFKPMTRADIERFVSEPKNWQGLAGAYAIQSTAGGALVKRVNGSVTGVVGLPLYETINVLKRCGFTL